MTPVGASPSRGRILLFESFYHALEHENALSCLWPHIEWLQMGR